MGLGYCDCGAVNLQDYEDDKKDASRFKYIIGLQDLNPIQRGNVYDFLSHEYPLDTETASSDTLRIGIDAAMKKFPQL